MREHLQTVFTDRSGTITTGGVAQTLAAANPQRSYLRIQNLSASPLYVNFGSAASAGPGSFKILSLGEFVLADLWGFCSVESVSIYGATTNQQFSAKEA